MYVDLTSPIRSRNSRDAGELADKGGGNSPVQSVLCVSIAKSTSFGSSAPSSERNTTLASYLCFRCMQMLKNKLNAGTYMLTTY